jgi:hypothetical protein
MPLITETAQYCAAIREADYKVRETKSDYVVIRNPEVQFNDFLVLPHGKEGNNQILYSARYK